MHRQVNLTRRSFLNTAALAITTSQLDMMAFVRARSSGTGGFSLLSGIKTWLNSQPLTPADLAGKVVLVGFWTYSCINWRRQVPYLRAWADRYKDLGLMLIGVHTPEFSFEKNIDNVRWALRDMRIDYPIAVDNDYTVWRSFSNESWPALYFIDAQGRIRHHVFGEGDYEQSERLIQTLLGEIGVRGIENNLVSVGPQGAEAAADWSELNSGENYVGYERTKNFSSPGGIKADKTHLYATADQLKLNHWALSGNWTIGKEAIVLNQPNGRIAYCFHARDLHLVMGPAIPGTPIPFRVLIDGQSPHTARGFDLDQEGNGTVVEPRMYQLIRQPSPIVDRKFEIEFRSPGVEVFSFTFG